MEDFRGDYLQVASLINEAWAENENQPLLYTPEFLRSTFAYPSATFSLAPTIYEGQRPVAFVAGFPRRIRLDGKELNIVLVTLLTVAPEYKRKGYGILLWSELVKRARASGFDGMINYCVEGDSMNAMIQGSCHRLGVPIDRVYSVSYLFGMLFPKADVCAAPPVSECVDTFTQLAAELRERTRLARTWSRDEASWQCSRDGALVEKLQVGSHRGMLSGYVMSVAGQAGAKCLLVEDILWGDLDSHDQEVLTKRFLHRAAASGARLAIIPMLGYAGVEPFIKNRCRPSRRLVHAYLTIWSDRPRPESLTSFYLDVL